MEFCKTKSTKQCGPEGKKCRNNILNNNKGKNVNYYRNFIKKFGSTYENKKCD